VVTLFIFVGVIQSSPGLATLAVDSDLYFNSQKSFDYIKTHQLKNGLWFRNLKSSTPLYSFQYILTMSYLNRTESSRQRILDLMNDAWTMVNAEGGFSTYPGGPSEYGLTLLGYLSAIVSGESETTPRMLKVSNFLNHTQDKKISFSAKPYLLLLGLDPQSGCLSSHGKSYWNLYQSLQSQFPWARTLLTPLVFLLTHGRVHPLDQKYTIQKISLPKSRCDIQWNEPTPNTKNQIKRWVHDHVDSYGLLFDYTPSSLLGFMLLDQFEEYAALEAKGIAQVNTFITQHDHGHVQQVAGDASVFESVFILKALQNLRSNHDVNVVLQKGLQAVLSKQQKTGGFGFSETNTLNPDVDSTLYPLRLFIQEYQDVKNQQMLLPVLKGAQYLLSLQNPDGGFATWENRSQKVLTGLLNMILKSKYPDIVFNESVPEHTGRVIITFNQIEELCRQNAVRTIFKSVDSSFCKKIEHANEQAAQWLSREVKKQGYVKGAWVSYSAVPSIMSAQALIEYVAFHRGTASSSVGSLEEFAQRGHELVQYVLKLRHSDGTWGEHVSSYSKKHSVPYFEGVTSQTAIVLQGFLYILRVAPQEYADLKPLIRTGIQWLLTRENDDGTFNLNHWMGVTFPNVEYIEYFYGEFGGILETLLMSNQEL
jgi:squalene cyclase